MSTPYVGEIRMFAGNFAPAGWMFCDGTLIAISENETLFNLIGTTYGGDGQSTFALPDFRGRLPVHQGTGTFGTTYQLGQIAGVEQVTLTSQTMPSHSHAYIVASADGDQVNPASNLAANSYNVTPYINDVADTNMNPNVITTSGGNQPHENMQPYLCVNFIISMFGVFPTQN